MQMKTNDDDIYKKCLNKEDAAEGKWLSQHSASNNVTKKLAEDEEKKIN